VTPGEGGGPPGSGFSYPLEYSFKIMGLAADDFPEHARRLVARVVAGVPAEGVTVRASGGGKYLSVSVTALLRSEAERVAVYEVLQSDPRVVFAL
jgi:putative lipoic acid-binding regulatory protein